MGGTRAAIEGTFGGVITAGAAPASKGERMIASALELCILSGTREPLHRARQPPRATGEHDGAL